MSRAKRILAGMKNFHFIHSGDAEVLPALPLKPAEVPIGVYENEPASLERAIVVTDSSLIIEKAGVWSAVPYASITKAIFPSQKIGVRELRLLMRDGSELAIFVSGGTEHTSDVFEFIRFLDRVLADCMGTTGTYDRQGAAVEGDGTLGPGLHGRDEDLLV